MPDDALLLLGEPEPPTYQELQDAIGEALHGKDWATIRVPATVAAAGAWVQNKVLPYLPHALAGTNKPFVRPFMMASASDSYALDGSRADALLGWTPRRRLQATLPTILHKLKLDPEKWYRRNGLEWPGVPID